MGMGIQSMPGEIISPSHFELVLHYRDPVGDRGGMAEVGIADFSNE